MNQVTKAIHRHPTRFFVALLVIHAAVWTALPALFFINLPLDVVEGLLYGREWQWGYDKLPPLPWWMLEATHRLFGPDLFFYALSQATVVAAFTLIWIMARQLVGPPHRLLGPVFFFYARPKPPFFPPFTLIGIMPRQLVGPVGALVAILIIDGLHFFPSPATKFNHDVIQLPFWAMTGFAYWAAM